MNNSYFNWELFINPLILKVLIHPLTLFVVMVVFCLSLVFNQKEIKPEYLYKYDVVNAKSKELDKGSTYYVLSFKNGEFLYVDFGNYSYYNIGDTVYSKKTKEDFYWIIIKPSNKLKNKIINKSINNESIKK